MGLMVVELLSVRITSRILHRLIGTWMLSQRLAGHLLHGAHLVMMSSK